MLVKSDSLQCKVVLTHEEVAALSRWLKARLVGGEMVAADQSVVEDFAANMMVHECQIAEREARIGEVERVVDVNRIKNAIQRLDINDFEQVKTMFDVPDTTAADFVDEASMVNVNEVAARLKAVGHNIVIDDQVGIYQVSRD